MNRRAPVNITDLQSLLTCQLCQGLLVNPTIIKECTHNFCRDCLCRYFSSKESDTDWNCPTCFKPVVSGRIKQQVRANDNLQEVIWRLFPSVYAGEQQGRREFYRDNSSALSETLAEFPKNGPYSLDEEHGRGERDLECEALKNNVTVMLSYLPHNNVLSDVDSSLLNDQNLRDVLIRTRRRAESQYGQKPKLLTAQAACEVAHIRSMLANVLECEQPQLIRIMYKEKFQLYLSEALGDIGEVTCCTQPNKIHLQFSIVPPDADISATFPRRRANRQRSDRRLGARALNTSTTSSFNGTSASVSETSSSANSDHDYER